MLFNYVYLAYIKVSFLIMCSGKVRLHVRECVDYTPDLNDTFDSSNIGYLTLWLQTVYCDIHKPCKDIKPRHHMTQAVRGTRDNIIINSLYYIGRSMEGDVVYMVIEYILVGVKTDRR
jgi:hypothetical protein